MSQREPKAFKKYKKGQKIPLRSYAAFVGTFNLLLGALVWKTRREKSVGNGRLDVHDLLLIGASTYKLSRTITKDAVTAPFRAPFTEFKEDLGYGEANERPRGDGLRQAVGELISCNYCMDMWVGLGLLAGLKTVPRQTRLVMSLFSAVGMADFMHVVYESRRSLENVLTLKEEQLEKRAS